jgi:hypothetical protein
MNKLNNELGNHVEDADQNKATMDSYLRLSQCAGLFQSHLKYQEG